MHLDRTDKIGIPIVVLIVGIRLSLSLFVNGNESFAYLPDSHGYERLANKTLQGVVYTLSPNDPLDLFRPPGYPAFLAVIIRIFGAKPGTIAFVQLVVSTATGCLLFILVRSRYTKETAYLVFSLYLIDPITIIWGLKILSETLFTFLMVLSFYFIDLWRRKGKNYLLLLSGLVIALGTLTRPIGQAIIFLILGFILFRRVDSTTAKRRMRDNFVPAFQFLFGCLVVLALWSLRNLYVWNCPTISPVSAINLRDWMAAKVIAEVDNIPLEQAKTQLRSTSNVLCPRNNLEYIQILAQHPIIYLKLHMGGTLSLLIGTNFDSWFQLFGTDYQRPNLWQPYLEGGLMRVLYLLYQALKDWPVAIITFTGLIVFQLFIYILAISGFLKGWRENDKDWRWWLSLLAASILLFVILPGPVGQERFRLPIQPLLILLCAIQMDVWLKILQSNSRSQT